MHCRQADAPDQICTFGQSTSLSLKRARIICLDPVTRVIPWGHESAVATWELNMQRAGRNSLFTYGERAEKCPDDIFFSMSVASDCYI